jgi:hypothetical protein
LQQQPTDGVHLKFEKKKKKNIFTAQKSEINGKSIDHCETMALTRDRLFGRGEGS